MIADDLVPPGSPGGTYLVFQDSGDVSVFHDGKVDPRMFGEKVISSEKITEVVWDPVDGRWVSCLRDGTELCRSKSKAEVVDLEHRILAEMEIRGERLPSNGVWSAIKKAARRLIRS